MTNTSTNQDTISDLQTLKQLAHQHMTNLMSRGVDQFGASIKAARAYDISPVKAQQYFDDCSNV